MIISIFSSQNKKIYEIKTINYCYKCILWARSSKWFLSQQNWLNRNGFIVVFISLFQPQFENVRYVAIYIMLVMGHLFFHFTTKLSVSRLRLLSKTQRLSILLSSYTEHLRICRWNLAFNIQLKTFNQVHDDFIEFEIRFSGGWTTHRMCSALLVSQRRTWSFPRK